MNASPGLWVRDGDFLFFENDLGSGCIPVRDFNAFDDHMEISAECKNYLIVHALAGIAAGGAA